MGVMAGPITSLTALDHKDSRAATAGAQSAVAYFLWQQAAMSRSGMQALFRFTASEVLAKRSGSTDS
jgi:hypothetical protein